MAFLAEALRAFRDADDEEQRRVKAMVVPCNPCRAVELVVAFAALRSRTVGDQLGFEDPHPDLEPLAEPPAPVAGKAGTPEGLPAGEPVDTSRLDAFARRVVPPRPACRCGCSNDARLRHPTALSTAARHPFRRSG